MSDVPERLTEKAMEIHREMEAAQTWPDTYAVLALALHEIEQAARAEGERAGAERMREAAAILVRDRIANGIVGHVSPGPKATFEGVATECMNAIGHTVVAAIRALTTAEPPKGDK